MTKLTLKRNTTSAAARPEPTTSTIDAWEWAAERLADLGFEPVPKPEGKPPRVPMTVGDLTPDQLMEMFAAYTAWFEYASLQVGAAEALEDDIEDDLNLAKARYMIVETEAGTDKVTVARARRDTDPKVIELQKQWRKARAVRKSLQTYLTNYEKTAAMLSRELTRRTSLGMYEGRR